MGFLLQEILTIHWAFYLTKEDDLILNHINILKYLLHTYGGNKCIW